MNDDRAPSESPPEVSVEDVLNVLTDGWQTTESVRQRLFGPAQGDLRTRQAGAVRRRLTKLEAEGMAVRRDAMRVRPTVEWKRRADG